MVPVRHIEFSKFIVYDMSCDLYCHAILLLCANVTEIEQSVAELSINQSIRRGLE